MKKNQGHFMIALGVLSLVSVVWIAVNLSNFGMHMVPIQSQALGGNSADRAVLELILKRYDALARNMSTRIETAERVLKKLATGGNSKQNDGPDPLVLPSDTAPEFSDYDQALDQATRAEDDETPEQRKRRIDAEEKEQLQLIGYDKDTKTFKQRFRSDFRCGERVPALPDGKVVECEAAGDFPCCNAVGWCGKSKNHCFCDSCTDWRNTVKISIKEVRIHTKKRECEEIAYSFGPQESATACADLVLAKVECGRLFMFSDVYKSWGCRCCAPGAEAGDEVKIHWQLWVVDTIVVPLPIDQRASLPRTNKDGDG